MVSVSISTVVKYWVVIHNTPRVLEISRIDLPSRKYIFRIDSIVTILSNSFPPVADELFIHQHTGMGS